MAATPQRKSTDLDITRSGELMIAQVAGVTDDGVEFVDAYIPSTEYQVIDSGRIVIPDGALAELRAAAKDHGLSYAEGRV